MLLFFYFEESCLASSVYLINLEVGESAAAAAALFAEVLLLLAISGLEEESEVGIVVGLFSLMKCILAKWWR